MAFFDTPSASVAARITTNGNLVNNGIAEKLGLTVQAVASFAAAFAVASAAQWKLTLIIFAVVPLNVVVTVACLARDTLVERRLFAIYGESSGLADEAFASICTAHAF